MISFSEVYQAALDSSSTQSLFDRIGEYILDANGSLIYDSYGNPIIDSPEQTHPFYTPAEKLALEGHFIAAKFLQSLGANQKKILHALAEGGHHSQIAQYLPKYIHDKRMINAIAHGYARGGFHDEVSRFHKQYKASPNKIAHGYALGGYHHWVELYREVYKAQPSIIAKGYAESGFHTHVTCYRKKHAASLSAITLGYFHGNYYHHAEKYKKLNKHNNITDQRILTIYREQGNIEKCAEFSARCLLSNYGDLGKSIIKAMDRLNFGQKNSKNPYWRRAEHKLKLIITAVNAEVKEDGSTNLAKLIENRYSSLHKALNYFRLVNITFFGKVSSRKTKSLLAVKEKIKPIKTKIS